MAKPNKRQAVQAAPESNEPMAVDVVATPVVEAAASVVEAAAPVVEAAAPVVEAAAPVVEAAAPVAQAAAPVAQAAASANAAVRQNMAQRLWTGFKNKSSSAGSSIANGAVVARNRVTNSSALERTAAANTALTLSIMAVDMYRNPGASLTTIAAATGLTAGAITAAEGAGYGFYRAGQFVKHVGSKAINGLVSRVKGVKRKADDLKAPVAPQADIQQTAPAAVSVTIDALAAAATQVTATPVVATPIAAPVATPVLVAALNSNKRSNADVSVETTEPQKQDKKRTLRKST